MPKVSIIVPVYNVEKYLDKCIQSLLSQSLADIEIILVNDASPDKSIDICRKYEELDPRVIVIDKKINEGLGFTRNAGIKEATGKYIAFCDSDDYVLPEMYLEMSNYMDENALDVCYCNYALDNDGIINYKSGSPDKEMLFIGKENVCHFLLEMIGPEPTYPSDVKYMVSSCMAMYSREIIKKSNIQFQSERKVLSEDTLFNMECLANSINVGYVPKQYYMYRYNPTSLSRTFNHKKAETFITLLKEVEKRLSNYYAEELYRLHFLRFVFYIFRLLIKYEAIKNIDGKRKEYIKERLENELLAEALDKYPYQYFGTAKRFFFYCMKKRYINLLIFMSLLENKLRKNV